jgi:hypothetical protein
VQIVLETLSQKTLPKNSAGGVAQGEDPEFKPLYCQKKTKKLLLLKNTDSLLPAFHLKIPLTLPTLSRWQSDEHDIPFP